ncbi:HepT-like ribonuclease domain-containing protein [Sphaerimonospora sp. CA-214678]|uniref:HepT-like ribonuclease domain-containing protein n=1 Tax=Sphaerimonospora sp. CA-214678 TaxID=3240029 RepID=UPI003D8FB046
MRNGVVHGYFSVDWKIVYNVATKNVPELEPQVLFLSRRLYPEISARLDQQG